MHTKKHHLITYLSAFTALILAIAIIRYPQEAFDASLYGLRLWLDIVLPALLPFFAMADILMGLGVVHFIGILLEPIMNPLFKIPGVGAFSFAMGLASGYPIGAKITGRLRRQNMISQIEAERLVCLAHTAGPLFMAGAVAVGMFNMPELALPIALSHYLAVILVGFIMRFHRGPEEKVQKNERNYASRALRELVQARAADGRPFGQLFSDAVRETFASMLFVGGCVMIFSVLIRILQVSGIINIIGSVVALILKPFNVSPAMVNAFSSGIFEITIGAQAASAAEAPLFQKVFAASAIIAWSGFSVHTQVAAMLHGTDIRLWPYFLARALHSFFAAVFTIILLNPLMKVVKVSTESVWLKPTFLGILTTSTKWCIAILAILLLIGIVVTLTQRVIVFWVTTRKKN
ncbi:MAG: sporulation integral membrane protein YlbJ [Firmicutes bacterium]|nr:sporulation integral membrane protein YlbJ [Bacillota bacterium]